ncbi:MAG: SDR family NAD(P)-dependent oxidoreductase [bacterium]|nr:MAG: SDR family NAD(P)-dependent oxidoreductase [bacterium]
MNNRRFHNRVAVIAGMSGDLESTISYQLAERGCHVVIGFDNEAKLCSLEKKLGKFRTGIVTQQTDISDDNSIKKLIQTALNHFARIDYLIYFGELQLHSSWQNSQIEKDNHARQLNGLDDLYLIHKLISHMQLRRTGHIINISALKIEKLIQFDPGNPFSKTVSGKVSDFFNKELKQNGIYFSTIYPYEYKFRHQENYNTKYGEKVSKAVLKTLINRKAEVSVPRLLPNMFSFINLFLHKLNNRLFNNVRQKNNGL